MIICFLRTFRENGSGKKMTITENHIQFNMFNDTETGIVWMFRGVL